METYYVYMLRCSDQSLYTGIAKNVEKRLAMHHSGKGSRYVAARLPALLVYQEALPSKSAALKREIQIKKLNRRQKEALLQALGSLA